VDEFETQAVNDVAVADAAARVARITERANALRDAAEAKQRQAKLCSQLSLPAWSHPQDVAAAWNARKGEVLGAVVGVHRFDELVQQLGLQRDQLGYDAYSTVWTAMVAQDHPWLHAKQNKATGELVLRAAPAVTAPISATVH
jgi:hypothetical protein